MSLKPEEIEEIIAKRFGELKDGNGFTASYLESFVEKMKDHDNQVKQRHQKAMEEYLAKKRRPQMICKNPQCRNDNEAEFENDERVAQVTCKRCGTVAKERQVHDGEWVRQFEGEVNPSFHGPPPDHNFSSGHNLQTGMAELPGGKKKQAKELAMAQKSVEMNLSSMVDVKKERKTRVGYKDQMKGAVFEQIKEIGDSIQLHGTIVERAETIFARYRDDTEQLTNRYEISAACLILAFREKLLEDGEAAVRNVTSSSSAGVPKATPEAVPEFKCKYCQFPFSLQRDKVFHQKQCEERPKTATNGHQEADNGKQSNPYKRPEVSNGDGRSSDDRSVKRLRPE